VGLAVEVGERDIKTGMVGRGLCLGSGWVLRLRGSKGRGNNAPAHKGHEASVVLCQVHVGQAGRYAPRSEWTADFDNDFRIVPVCGTWYLYDTQEKSTLRSRSLTMHARPPSRCQISYTSSQPHLLYSFTTKCPSRSIPTAFKDTPPVWSASLLLPAYASLPQSTFLLPLSSLANPLAFPHFPLALSCSFSTLSAFPSFFATMPTKN